MKKKVVSLLLVGVLAMSTFVGCGSKGSSDATSDDSSSDDSSAAAMYTSDDENTLTVAAWDASFNIPAIEAAQAEGINADGPVPPDSLFSKARGGWYDIVVAMYYSRIITFSSIRQTTRMHGRM